MSPTRHLRVSRIAALLSVSLAACQDLTAINPFKPPAMGSPGISGPPGLPSGTFGSGGTTAPSPTAKPSPAPSPSPTPEKLAINAVSPDNGIPGDLVTVTGSGFKLAPAASYSVKVGAVAIPSFQVFIRGADRLLAVLPTGFKRGRLTIDMGGETAQSPADLVQIASVSITPLSFVLAPAATAFVEPVAYDPDGNPIAAPALLWGMQNEVCFGNLCEDNDAAKVCTGPRCPLPERPEPAVADGRKAMVTAEVDVGMFQGGKRVSPSGEVVAYGTLAAGNLNLMATASVKIVIP
jgi:hypothetical protein